MKMFVDIPVSHWIYKDVVKQLESFGCELSETCLCADFIIRLFGYPVSIYNPRKVIFVGDFSVPLIIPPDMLCVDIHKGMVLLPDNKRIHWKYYLREFLIPIPAGC
jgi:hypothetical protein